MKIGHPNKIKISVGAAALILLQSFTTFADHKVPPFAVNVSNGPREDTIEYLEDCYKALRDFKKACGRFPLSSEGLQAFRSKPAALDCPKFSSLSSWNEHAVFRKIQDAWDVPLNYSSNGKTYRIVASHGFSLTEKSPNDSDGHHWENPNPPTSWGPVPDRYKDLRVY